MKQIIYLTLLLIVIPFFVVFFLLKVDEIHKEKVEEISLNLEVKVKHESTGVIEKVALEEYVVGVVAGEMPISFHIEALKAQAVAARSYVLRRMAKNPSVEYDVVDSTTNQVYLTNDYLKEKWKDNYETNISKLREAVSDTAYQYISYNGEIADALFFSTSNGYTENSEEIFSVEEPYLRSVVSAWDESTSPVFSDQKVITLDDFYTNLGLEKAAQITIEVLNKSSTGRILKLKINGHEMKGSDVATKLKLRSNDFEIVQTDNNVTIKTNGYGHGVGMSQYGALGMANEGYTYDKILKYYYQGIEIKTLKH